MSSRRLRVILLSSAICLAGAARAAEPNVMVLRVGDGQAALTNSATAAFLEERTSAGSVVRTITLPTVANGANKACTLSGSSTLEGLISRSSNGAYVCVLGYGAATGTASVGTSPSNTVNRVIARVDINGTIDTSTALTDAANGVSARSATSSNGLDFWVSGGAGGVRYCLLGSTSSMDLTSATLANARQLNVFGSQLYVSSGSTGFRGVSTVGSGLPTTSAQTVAPLPGVTDTDNPSAAGFFFADLDATVPGVDTLYIADNSSHGINKYALVNGTWVLKDIADAGNAYSGLTGSVSGSTVRLYMTRGNGAALLTLVDTDGYNLPYSGTSPALIASAPANTAFRGVAMAPAAPVDLTLTAADAPHTVVAGSGAGNLIYTISLKNNSLADATGVQVTVNQTLPTGVTLAGSSPSAGIYNTNGGIWTVGPVAAGATATLMLTETVGASAAIGANAVSLTANISACDNPLLNTGDDSATRGTDITFALVSGPTALPQSATVGQSVAFAVNVAGSGVSYAWDFGDGSIASGAAPTHAYAAAGTFNATVIVSGFGRSPVTASVPVTVIVPPVVLLSGPTATPQSAGVGQSVAFAVSTEGNDLTYSWDFGDGSAATGQTPSHAYAAAETFNPTVTITRTGTAPLSASVAVTVTAPAVGTGNDSDGDGFSDEIETLAGTDAQNPASTPTGQPGSAGSVQALTISKVSIKLNFTTGGKDSIAFSGTLPIPVNFAVDQASVSVDAGGVGRKFTLGAKGKVKVGGDSLKLSVKAVKGVVSAQTAKYSASFTKGTFAALLADEGLTPADIKAQPRTVVFTIVFNNTALQSKPVLSYTAKKSKTGMAKLE